tara:strand:+ start:1221 stop:1391 length:171 start_codon:yes stop_codon:yes gene_type:complete
MNLIIILVEVKTNAIMKKTSFSILIFVFFSYQIVAQNNKLIDSLLTTYQKQSIIAR